MNAPSIFLVDNGSLRPEATIALRALAEAFSERAAMPVEAVSLLHSHKIDPGQLGGVPATIVKRRMREQIAEGQRDFLVVPLFLGPSLAITDYLPKVIEELRAKTPGLNVRIAAPLAGANAGQPDLRLAQILKDHLQPFLHAHPRAQIALVDHGTPIQPVNQLRNAVARQLADELGRNVQPCSMERREGPGYDFNEPLLEDLSDRIDLSRGPLVLAMFFLLPGRHAGAGGDVASIADGLKRPGSDATIRMTPLLAEHPLLLEILLDRLNAVC